SPGISGTLNYTMASDTTPKTGTLNGTSDYLYVYQGQGPNVNGDCDSVCKSKLTTDTGYVMYKNATPLVTGNNTKVLKGWGNIEDSGGKGVQIGINQMSAFFPKSLEFN